ncbi:shikimate dehydrogenase [Pseudodesulfovibrio sp. JC047]|nr:shikimate dehydrogenase [Pseudodesulfovibrio sp. JC047]NDV20272.1 shikimate dehydrogenase [Pseudodesulfovibrio sp. JC047]
MNGSYGIIGWPLGHTMSPTLHSWGFEQFGMDARYTAWPVAPDELAPFMERVRTQPVAGLSVTIPHKQTVMPFLDRISDRAARIGAVNTVYWDGDVLCGENTDITGFVAPLHALSFVPASALVLGAGGAARAALAGLKELGVTRLAVTNRTLAKAEALAAAFAVDCVAWESRMDSGWQLVCNTTPLGMSGAEEARSPWDAQVFSSDMLAYDIVYNPLETRFLREAREAGCRTVSGLDMFVQQGLAQFALWTGQSMDAAGAKGHLLGALKG